MEYRRRKCVKRCLPEKIIALHAAGNMPSDFAPHLVSDFCICGGSDERMNQKFFRLDRATA
jgi:hypothetical protein